METHQDIRTATERWFVKRGVPHFIEEYNASEDVLTRALPFLTFTFLLSAISAIDLDWPALGIVAASLGGLAILIGVWMLINRSRGRYPLLRRPDSIGTVEIAVFLGLPTLLPLIFGGDVRGAGATFLSQLALLAIVYAITSYGVIAITLWVGSQLARSLGQTIYRFARTLPLLLIGFMFLFLNAEAWQSAGRLDSALLVATGGLFAALATAFVGTQTVRDLVDLNRFATWQEVDQLCENTPSELIQTHTELDVPPLARHERGNLWLVLFVSQTFRLVLASALIGLFFVGLGLIIIRPETVELWTTDPSTTLWTTTLFGSSLELSAELLRVSGFLAAFAFVYFSVHTTTDHGLRDDFYDDIITEVRQNLAVRVRYLATSEGSAATGD